MRVAVLEGGPSGEHDVSVASAAAVREGLAETGHEAVAVQISRAGRWRHDDEPVTLVPAGGLLGCDVVFPALHGPYGEDGTVQGLLEALDVPYVGAGVAASAVCMDKLVFKDLMRTAGFPQVDYLAAREGGDPAALAPLGLPVFVKPASLGSSVGISKVMASDELPGALQEAFRHDPVAIVEAMATGMEVECSVLGNGEPEASLPGEIVLGSEWYDHRAKYGVGGMELVVPARLPDAVREQVREMAVEVFKRVGCAGMARCDFFVEDPGGQARILLNELNTIPGFTKTSVYAKLFEASGIPYPELLDRLVGLAVDRHAAIAAESIRR